MKIFLVIVLIIHGLIHLLGFVNGMGFIHTKEMTLPISKPMGFMWLMATILFLVFVVFILMDYKHAWLIGLVAVAISEVLIILSWQDSKFGTIPNLIALIACILLWGAANFHNQVEQETKSIISKSKVDSPKIVGEADIQALPEPVKKWLKASGVIGKPYITIGKIMQRAEMKMKPEQKNWMTANATQYTTIDNPAFIWSVDVKMNQLVHAVGMDKFEDGKGAMLIKINSLFTIVNAHGEKLNEATLQRYLGEMVWFPSLAIHPNISWESIDASSAKATMRYNGTSGSGIFYFNENGDVSRFTAERYKDQDENAKRMEWNMNISAYKTFEGIKVPAVMTSTWKLDQGDWTWLKLEVIDLKFNRNALQ